MIAKKTLPEPLGKLQEKLIERKHDAALIAYEPGHVIVEGETVLDCMGLIVAVDLVSRNPRRYLERADDDLRQAVAAASEDMGGTAVAVLAYTDEFVHFYSAGKTLAMVELMDRRMIDFIGDGEDEGAGGDDDDWGDENWDDDDGEDF